jgi:hypothetical protein
VYSRKVRKVWIKNCTECSRLFVGRHPSQITCGEICSKEHRRKRSNRSDDYHRWKRSKRRTITRESDITPAQEADLRRRTRKCKLCGVFMTSKAHLPTSKELDHILPVGVGGTHTHGNVRIICRLCNQKRPKDGSDYMGQLTLWAMTPGVVITAKLQPVIKIKPSPKLAQCRCGVTFTPRSRQKLCHPCIESIGKQAAKMRNEDWAWQDIADELGYTNVGSLYNLAVKYGQLSVPRCKRAA